MTTEEKLGFYATPPHDCNYLPGQEAITLFADPRFRKNTRLYAALAGNGFRRSGEHLYIPYCRNCSACVPVRIPVREFRHNRSQARCRRRNSDLRIRPCPPAFDSEHFALYRRYLAHRHRGGGMDDPTPESYVEFLTATWSDTTFFEMRAPNGALVAVSVVDAMPGALSAVYTFFEPDLAARSPGTFAILFQVEEARRRGCDYVYLGYWIEACRKMRYKRDYHPLEFFRDGEWRREPSGTGLHG
jgi:arginine-tRNA-protein transferase